MVGLVVAAVLAATPPLAPPGMDVPEAPYVSCPGGYVAPALEDCPYVPQLHRQPEPPKGGHGGPRRSGLLGLGIGGIL